MYRDYKISHLRFDSEGDKVHKTYRRTYKIVTIAFRYWEKSGLLNYGATIYKKTNPKDFWNRKKHIDRAVERLTNCPVTVNTTRDKSIEYIDSNAIAWLICNEMIPYFGCSGNNSVFTYHIYPYFNKRYYVDRYFYEGYVRYKKRIYMPKSSVTYSDKYLDLLEDDLDDLEDDSNDLKDIDDIDDSKDIDDIDESGNFFDKFSSLFIAATFGNLFITIIYTMIFTQQ